MIIKSLCLLAMAIFTLVPVSYSQEERLLHEIKRTIYSKVSGHEGSNIKLTLLVYDKSQVKIAINGFSSGTEFNDTINVHELNYFPIQNSIVQKLKSHSIGSAEQTVSEILEFQSQTTINLMVLEAQAFLTSSNNLYRNSITALFGFKTKIPIFVVAQQDQINKLHNLVGYSTSRKKADSSLLGTEIKILTGKYNEATSKIDELVKRNLSSTEVEQLKAQKLELDKIENILQDKKQEISMYEQNMRSSATGYYLIGFAFIKRNEVVVNKGFIKTIRMVLEDSIELRYRFGGGKVTLSKLNINKIIDYNLSIDIRSISGAHRGLETYTALWKFGNSKLFFWTKLSEVISYDSPEDADITDLFVVKQQRLVWKAGQPNVISVPETDINTVIQLNIFTDLIGVQEDQPNGLIQVEGTFKTHLFNWGIQRKYRKNNLFFLDHVDANLRFSKIENKLRYINAGQVKGGSKITFIPNFQLMQFANLDVGAKFSTFKFVSYKREFNMYFGLGILRTGLRDTTFAVVDIDTTKIPRSYNIFTFMQFLQAHLKIKASSYMGVDLSARLIWLRLMDSDVKQSGGNFSREVNVFSEFSSKRNVLFNPQFQVYYMPNKDESKRLYLRCGFTHDIGTKSNNFLNIQVGLSSDINKFLNFKTNQID